MLLDDFHTFFSAGKWLKSVTFPATFPPFEKGCYYPSRARKMNYSCDSQSLFHQSFGKHREQSSSLKVLIWKLRHFSVATLLLSFLSVSSTQADTTTLKVKLEKCTEHIRQFWSLCQTMICIMWIFSWDLRPPYDNSSQMTVSRLHGNYFHFRHFGHPSSIAETAVQLALTFCWPSFS